MVWISGRLRTQIFISFQHDFTTPHGFWQCRLAEVSDLRPQSDRLAWYLTFHREHKGHGEEEKRNLEVLRQPVICPTTDSAPIWRTALRNG